MLEIAVLVILALAFVGGHVLAALKGAEDSQPWPAIRPDLLKSEPADEGAPVPEAEQGIRGAELPKAA